MNGANNHASQQFLANPFPSSITTTTPSSAFKYVNQTLQHPPSSAQMPSVASVPNTSTLPPTVSISKQPTSFPLSYNTLPLPSTTSKIVPSSAIPSYSYHPFMYGQPLFTPNPISSSSQTFSKSFSFSRPNNNNQHHKLPSTSGSFQSVKNSTSFIENTNLSKKLDEKVEDSKQIVNSNDKEITNSSTITSSSTSSVATTNETTTNKHDNLSTASVTVKKERQQATSTSANSEKSFVTNETKRKYASITVEETKEDEIAKSGTLWEIDQIEEEMRFDKRAKKIEALLTSSKMEEYLSQYMNTKSDSQSTSKADHTNSSEDLSDKEEIDEPSSIADVLRAKKERFLPVYYYGERKRGGVLQPTIEEVQNMNFQTYVKRKKVPSNLEPSFTLDEQTIEHDLSLLCK